jgi:MFS transporter, DHA1 family, inner membrane transport protein
MSRISRGEAPPARSLTGAVILLACATGVIVATEFIVVGLLPVMARDLDVSLAEAGSFVTWFALSSAILGPILTIVVSRIEPCRVLVAALLVFGFGNLVVTLVPSYITISAVRIIQGAALPVFVSVANAAIARLAGPGREGRAIALVNIGVVAGLVLAVPAGVALADHSGWLMSFIYLAALAMIATAAIGAGFPRIGTADIASIRAQAMIVRRPWFQAHLLLSAVLFTAMFAAYTYLAAFLEIVAGFDGRGIAQALAGFGVAGLLGNWVAGRVVGRGPTAATAGVAFALALATMSVSLAGGLRRLLLPVLAFWGAAHAAAFVLCQVRVMFAGASAPAFASALNISACNVGIAAGAIAGGAIVEHSGIASIGFGSAGLALFAFVIAVLVRVRDRSPDRAGERTGSAMDASSVKTSCTMRP